MGKMPLYTMLQKARSAGGWTMVAQLEGDAAGSQLLLLEGRPVWQRGDSTVLLQHLTELQGCTAAGIHSVAGTDIFAERFGAVPQLVVCGGGHVAAAVVQRGPSCFLQWTCVCSRCAACKAAGPDGPCNG